MTARRWHRTALIVALATLVMATVQRRLAQAGPSGSQRDVPDRYPFCHDRHYVLHPSERQACHYAKAARERCPGLFAACQRPATTTQGAPDPRLLPSANPTTPARARSGSSPPSRSNAFSTSRAVFGALLAAALLLSFAFALWWAARRRRRAPRIPLRAWQPAATPSAPLASGPELLSAARQALAREQAERAFESTFAALLFHLERQGRLRRSSARTTQEYVRDVAPYPDAHRLLCASSRELDAMRFADRPISLERARQFLEAASRFVDRSAGIVAIAYLGFMLATGCALPQEPSPRTRAWSRLMDPGPNGFSRLASLLERQQRRVNHHLGDGEALLGLEGTLVIYDQRRIPTPMWEALKQWSSGNNQLVIVGPGAGLSYFGRTVHPLRCPELILEPRSELRLAPPPTALAPLAPNTPSCNMDHFAVHPKGAPGVVLLPTALMLSNAALHSADNAPLLLSWLGRGDVTFVGPSPEDAGAESPYDAVAQLGAGPWLLQLGLLLLAIAVMRGTTFGTPRPPPPKPRRDLIEHVRALGATLARARASNHALSQYARYQLEALEDRLGPVTPRTHADLAASIAERTRTPVNDVLSVLEGVRQAREDESLPAHPSEDLALMHALQGLIASSRGDRE